MKKILSILIVFLSLAASTPTYSFEVDGLRFFPEQNGHSVSLLGDKNIIGEIVIPETVEYEGKTYTVTSIGSRAFSECTGLTSVTIPKSVTSIGHRAFEGCSSLTSVTIPNSVTSIGNDAFQDCTGLTGDLKIPDSVIKIGDGAFDGCSGLTSVTIGNSVTSIGHWAFAGCTGLTGELTIPDSVKEIGNGAFSGCTNLTSVIIGNLVTKIGESVFSGCTGLTSVTIPKSVISIGHRAFDGCSGLTSINIPKSVKSIGQYAFYDCSGLTGELIIPNSVTDIGSSAFNGCTGLTSVTISKSVTMIFGGIFNNCTNLTSVTYKNPNTLFFANEFIGCNNLRPENIVLHYVEDAFKVNGICYNICDDEESVVLTFENSSNNDNDTTMNYSTMNYSIKNYSNLSGKLVIPKSVEYNSKSYLVTSIGDNAFKGCTGLTSVIIPNSVTSIGNDAFQDCTGLTGELTIPDSVKEIGNGAFSGCTNLTSVTIPNSVTTIGSSAFSGCTNLTSVTIPNSVTTIGGSAFSGCTGLTSVTIPNSVTMIGNSAFSSCTGLVSLEFPNSATEIIGNEAFAGCTGLTGELILPNSLITIDDRAFEGCTGLTSVTIPNSVTTIGDHAFSGCTGLTTVTIGNSVTTIGDNSFSHCIGLTKLDIPNSVASIGSYAFYNCIGLETINSLISEPQNVIYNTSIDGTKDGIFGNVNINNCIVNVPKNATYFYTITSPWFRFKKIIGNENLSINNYKTSKAYNQNIDSLKQQAQQIIDKPTGDSEGKFKIIGDVLIQSPEFLNDPSNYSLIIFLAKFYVYKKEYNNAILCYEAAMKTYKNNYSNNSEEYFIEYYGEKYKDMLINVANCYHEINNLNKEIDCYKQAIDLSVKAYELTEDSKRLDSVDELCVKIGGYYVENKAYDDAKIFFDKAIIYYPLMYWHDRRGVFYIIKEIGQHYFNSKVYDEARTRFEEALKLELQLKEEEININLDIEIADCLKKIGNCYYLENQFTNAREKYEEAYNICRDQRNKADLLYRVGTCYYLDTLYSEAIEKYKAAKYLIREVGLIHEVIKMDEKIGKCYHAKNDLDSALYYYSQVWDICNEAIEEHESGKISGNYMFFSEFTGLSVQLCIDYSQCALPPNKYNYVYSIFRKTLNCKYKDFIYSLNPNKKNIYSFKNSQERTDYWKYLSILFQEYYPAVTFGVKEANKLNGIKLEYEDITEDLYNKSALFAKGFSLASENELTRIIVENCNDSQRAKYYDLQKRILESKKDETFNKQNENYENLMAEQEEFYKLAFEIGDPTHNLKLTWDSVKAKLDSSGHDIAIEFLSFPKFGTDSVMYIALTVRNNDDYKQPKMIFLCSEEDLKAADAKGNGRDELSKLIWGMLDREGELDSVKNIYFSPSGLLHTIPIESLPHWDGSGKLITDSSYGLHFYRLSSTRELAMRHTPVTNSDTVTASVYGGILYKTPIEMLPYSRHGRKNTAMVESTENEQTYLPSTEFINQINESDFAYANSRAVEIRHYEDGRPYIFWKPLKGSRIEADSIVSLFSNKGIQIQNDYYNESSATETSFKNLAGQKKRIIHISTHGFYWNDSTAREIYKELPISFMDSDNDNLSPEDQAMSRCGLLFSGAQHIFDGDSIQSDKDDCVLTAQEVSQLDLRGLELLVLSACQTGLGEIGGDGVFGLQRGFKKAGAQSIIMSLWEVNDLATRDMMIKFYEYLNPDLSNKQEAFLKAQEDVRDNDKNYTYDEKDPVNDARLRATRPHWAAFILLDAL